MSTSVIKGIDDASRVHQAAAQRKRRDEDNEEEEGNGTKNLGFASVILSCIDHWGRHELEQLETKSTRPDSVC